MDVSIHHWRYEDGWHNIPYVLLKDKSQPAREFRQEVIGWHCWVYGNRGDFMDWMKENCPNAECTVRFNSGNPIVTVHIKNKDEAAYFMLNFNV